MKHIINFLFLIVINISLFAQNAERQKKAEDFYKAGNYTAAIEIYENLLPTNEESAEVYYNLGNAYYKNGQIALSILNYERALRLKPNFDDAQFNLDLANEKTADKIVSIDDFFLVSWLNGFANMMSSNAWAVWSILFFILTVIFVFVYIFLKNNKLQKVSFYAAMAGLLFVAISFSMSCKQKNRLENRDYAIVMSPVVTATSNPTAQGTKLFVMHEGVKVKIKNTSDVWVEIVLANGQVGWIKAADIEKI